MTTKAKPVLVGRFQSRRESERAVQVIAGDLGLQYDAERDCYVKDGLAYQVRRSKQRRGWWELCRTSAMKEAV